MDAVTDDHLRRIAPAALRPSATSQPARRIGIERAGGAGDRGGVFRMTRASLPPPSAGEGTLRSRGGEGSAGSGRGRPGVQASAFSGTGAPLSRPLPRQGPPSPAEGGGSTGDPWADALRAAHLLAADPHGLGGALVHAAPGPVRERWLDCPARGAPSEYTLAADAARHRRRTACSAGSTSRRRSRRAAPWHRRG